MKVLRRSDYKHQTLTSSKTGEAFSASAVLSETLGSKDFFIHHEILSPGHRASAPHAHVETEEWLWILKGQATVRFGDEARRVGPGDLVFFDAGATQLHCVLNDGMEDAEFLVISKKLSKPDVVFEI